MPRTLLLLLLALFPASALAQTAQPVPADSAVPLAGTDPVASPAPPLPEAGMDPEPPTAPAPAPARMGHVVPPAALDHALQPAGIDPGAPAPPSPDPTTLTPRPAPVPALAPDPNAFPPAPDPAELARTLAAGLRPRRLELPTHEAVPYGYETPTLRCHPLRACAVELESGETVLNTVAGDSERWLVDQAAAGPAGHTPVLAIKPTECDISTNLLVTTDRRLYQLILTAPPCPRGPDALPAATLSPLLRFYYPDALVRTWTRARVDAEAAALADADARLPLASAVPLNELNFRYRFERPRRFPWRPEIAFDDGKHTYIRVPVAARRHPTPVLFVLRDGGATELLNYAYRPGPAGTAYYVTDRVLDRAVFVIGSGRAQRRLNVTNLALAR